MSYPQDRTETIQAIARQCGDTESSKGFRKDWLLADELDAIVTVRRELDSGEKATIQEAAAALRANYVGTKLMLIVTEAAEAMETLRDVGIEGILNGEGNFGEELDDMHIRAWALAEMLDLDAGKVTDKMNSNKGRPMMHGRKM